MLTDLRFAVRMLIKYPAFSLVAFLALVLGIGANTTVFGIINALLLRPLPVGHAEQMVKVFTTDNHIPGNQSTSYLNFQDYEKQNTVFSAMSAYTFAGVGMSRGNDTLNVGALLVTGNYFDLLQVKPSLGRAFLPEEDSTPNGHPVVVLGYKFWKKLGSDPAIIGSQVTLNGHSFTVIGVAPAAFTGVDVGFSPDLWVPMSMHQWVRPGGDFWWETRRALLLSIVARLNPGVPPSEAQAQMRTIAKRLEQAYPDVNKERSIALMSLEAAKAQGLGGPTNENLAQNVSLLLLVASASILLIACANVANLLLARSTARQREMAVRLALGAGRDRIVRQLLTESILLGVLGGVGGVILAYALGNILIALLPPTPFPIDLNPNPDWRVLIFSLLVAVSSGIFFGLAPALHVVRGDVQPHLASSGQGIGVGFRQGKLRAFLVVAEVALSIVLLIGAGLLMRSFLILTRVDLGFDPKNVLYFELAWRDSYNFSWSDPASIVKVRTRKNSVTRQLLERMKAVPGVLSAAECDEEPPLKFDSTDVIIPGRPHVERWEARLESVSEDYFQTLGVPLLRGRDFSEDDVNAGRYVMVINQAFARQYFPNEDPLGRKAKLAALDQAYRDAPRDTYFEIVGVVANYKSRDYENPSWQEFPEAFIPYSVEMFYWRTIMARTSVNATSVLKGIAKEVQSVDSGVAIGISGMLEASLSEFYRDRKSVV